MALSANTVLEVRNGGSDTNGGGFVTGAAGTDWSQQDTAQYSVTDGVTAGTTTITSATANFGTDVVGNLIYVQGGTGSVVAGWYQITARASATSITVDRSTGLTAGTGVTLIIGGALASPGQAAAIATVAGMTVFIKYHASPYVATTASTNVSGGCVSGTASTWWAGYDTVRSIVALPANRPTFQVGAAVGSATLFGNLNATYFLSSMILDGNGQTSSIPYNSSGVCLAVKCINGTSGGMRENTAQGLAILCEIASCSSTVAPFLMRTALWCLVHDNTNIAANVGALQCTVSYGCVSYGNARAGYLPGFSAALVNSIAYDNDEDGVNAQNNSGITCINFISEANGRYGYRTNTGHIAIINSAAYNNTSGRSNVAASGQIWADFNPIDGAGSFFEDAANQDFRLNGSAGAALKAAGFPSALPDPAELTAILRDIGAAQHQDSGGSGSGAPGNMSGGMQ